MNYRFVIDGKASEAYDEEAIRNLVKLRVICADTLAWCETMDTWTRAGEIRQLTGLFSEATASAEVTSSPPIPAGAVCGREEDTARPSQVEAIAVPSPPPPVKGTDSLQETARRLIYWFFRPWNGHPSRVRGYIDQNPRQAIPIAAGLVAGMFLLVCLAISPLVSEYESPRQQGQMQPAMPQAGAGGFNMENWRIMQDAQRHNENVISDSYQYGRDSFDRQSETYGRATYDWRDD